MIKKMYNKYRKIIMYLFFGGCTTIVNILSYYVMAHIFKLPVVLSTIIAWILAVLFAYFTNRKWVFDSKVRKKQGIMKEMILFFSCRLMTGILDCVAMYLFVERFEFNDIIVKIVVNIVVIILNYIASKFIVFSGKDILKNKKEIWIYLSFALIVFIFLFKSPLHIWVGGDVDTDSGVFKTIALMMQRGYMPYLDSFDHKGPLIYIYNYLGNLISNYRGVFLIEFVSLWISACTFYKIARLKCDKLISYVIVLLSFTLLFDFFQGGNFVEEYALPFIGISLFIFLDYLINKKINNKRIIICGFSLGAVLLLRPNMIATWVVYSIYIFFKCIKNEEYKDLKRFILLFLLGLSIIIIPIIAWLLVKGAFCEFWNSYITFNSLYSSVSLDANSTRLINVWASLVNFINKNVILISFITVIFLIKKEKNCVCYLIYMIVTMIFICISGRTFAHYMMIFVPVIIYPFALLFELLGNNKHDKNGIARFSVLIYLMSSIILPVWLRIIRDIPNIYYNRNNNGISSDIINASNIIDEKTGKDDKISVYGNLGIIYVISDRAHATKYSYQFPIGTISEQIMNEYFKELEEEKPKIIVVGKTRYDEKIEEFLKDNNYNLISGNVNKNEKELLLFEIKKNNK